MTLENFKITFIVFYHHNMEGRRERKKEWEDAQEGRRQTDRHTQTGRKGCRVERSDGGGETGTVNQARRLNEEKD